MKYKIVDGVLVLTAEIARDGVLLGRLEHEAEGQGIAELGYEAETPYLTVPMRKREAKNNARVGKKDKVTESTTEEFKTVEDVVTENDNLRG